MNYTLPVIFALGALTFATACEREPPPIRPGPATTSPVTAPPRNPGESAKVPSDDDVAPIEEVEEPVSDGPPLVAGDHPPQVDNERISASQLIALGKRYQARRRWQPASALFQAAFRREQKNAMAHYLYARAKARQRQDEGPCIHEARASTILMHLDLAVAADSSLRRRMHTEKDFSGLTNTIWYRVVDGASLIDPDSVADLVTRATFHKPAQGPMSPDVQLDFQAGGTMMEKQVNNQTGASVFRPRKGTWKASAGKITVDFGDGVPVTYKLGQRGDLVSDNKIAWTELPEECDA